MAVLATSALIPQAAALHALEETFPAHRGRRRRVVTLLRRVSLDAGECAESRPSAGLMDRRIRPIPVGLAAVRHGVRSARAGPLTAGASLVEKPNGASLDGAVTSRWESEHKPVAVRHLHFRQAPAVDRVIVADQLLSVRNRPSPHRSSSFDSVIGCCHGIERRV